VPNERPGRKARAKGEGALPPLGLRPIHPRSICAKMMDRAVLCLSSPWIKYSGG